MSARRPVERVARALRDWLAGPGAALELKPVEDFRPEFGGTAGLYVHVPFCRSLCPYCPYLRQRYRPDLVGPYLAALGREMRWYRDRLPGLRADSVYFGGGTPTVLGPALPAVVETLRGTFEPSGPFCIETTPSDLTADKVRMLASLGFGSISLGVQSFDPDTLRRIGRDYPVTQAERALDWIGQSSIPSVNLDLMFAVPGQSARSWQRDIERATASCATQITAYPLFTFPYSSAGRAVALQQLRMPSLRARRRQYYQLYDTLLRCGFQRVSVWSFSRSPWAHRFSSVTRHRYLGFGPGAGSHMGPQFTLNTFSLPEYERVTAERGHAVALAMDLSPQVQILHDVYWRLYETVVPLERHAEGLDYRLENVQRLQPLLIAARALGLCRMEAGVLSLTRRGSLWLHWLQNYLALPAVNTLWTASHADPWPARVRI
jgi:oxygen-independent coproporphyrinogen-3 oxidase